MKNNKITPQARHHIISRVKSGEKQVDLAKEYGVSKGYISQIMKASQRTSDTPDRSLEAVEIENLRNREREVSREIAEVHTEKDTRLLEVMRLRGRLENETKRLQGTDDAELRKVMTESMNITQSLISWNENQKRLDMRLVELIAEQLAIYREFVRRGTPIPLKPTH